MKPVALLPAAACARVGAVFSDLDDTLTTAGRIPAAAYRAMWALERAGIALVIVTGRPSGWADALLRLMPVRAVVAENGAVTLDLDRARGRLVRRYVAGEAQRRRARRRLDRAAARILRQVPGLRLAADQKFRETDIAFDLREDAAPPGPAAVARLRALLDEARLSYRLSSIHLNAWVGRYDKRSACARLLERMERENGKRIFPLFIGDSPNDEPLFAAFPLSVGVANVRDFAAGMKALPAYVTRGRGGEGFAEMARRLLASRR